MIKRNSFFVLFLFCGLTVMSQDSTEILLIHYQYQNDIIDASSNGFDGTSSSIAFREDQESIPLEAAEFNIFRKSSDCRLTI